MSPPCNAQPGAGRWRVAVLAWLAGAALAAVLYRRGPILGYDSFFYCEFAKRYATAWPEAFGNHWPCGYPLLGGLLGRLGIPAYPALVLVSLGSLAALTLLAARWTGDVLLIAALAATPIVSEQVFGAATELPFGAALLGLAAALAAMPKRSAFWAAGACAVLALALRYAGVLAFALLWTWLALNGSSLRARRRLGQAVAAAAVATAVAAALLAWNLAATGHLSGADRAAAEDLGLRSLPRHLSDFGWSIPAASMLGGLRGLLSGSVWPGEAIGWAFAIGGGAFCLWAAIFPKQPWVRPVALSALFYGAGMVALRACGSFDALYGGRVALPAVFPAGLAAVGQFYAKHPGWTRGAAAAALLVAAASGARGMSRQIAGDVGPAVPILKARLKREDVVQIDANALSLAAYLPERVVEVWPATWSPDLPGRFLVAAAPPLDREGHPGELQADWARFCDRLAAEGSHRFLLKTRAVVVLERVGRAPDR